MADLHEKRDWVDRWSIGLMILGVVMVVVILAGAFAACMQMAHHITR